MGFLMLSWGVSILFLNLIWGNVFLKNRAKSKVVKITSVHRTFLSNFDVNLGSWGMIHSGDNRPLDVSTKPLQLLLGFSAGFFWNCFRVSAVDFFF